MDLYDDLDFALVEPVSAVESRPEDAPECKKLKTECKAKESKISELSDKVQQLEAQNKILRKNITCLFKTAKAEVQRKDSTIQEQRDKIVRLEASIAAESRDCGYLGNNVMMSSASTAEQDMLQLWLLQCQQQQLLYGGNYTGFSATGAWEDLNYTTYPDGYHGSLPSEKRSVAEERDQSRRRSLRESQATTTPERHSLSRKPDRHRDRHRSGSKRRK